MRYKAKTAMKLTQALPLVNLATNDEGTLWNIEQERGTLCVEFTSTLPLENIQAGLQNAAKALNIQSQVELLRLR